jgi:hypothetical protein
MKRCPNCQRTYEDNMKFCQADGTPLVDDAPQADEANDPFKTVLANPPSDKQESDFDPMKTMLATPPPLDAPPPSPFGTDKPKDSGINAPSFGDLGSPQFNDSPLPSESAPPQDRQSGGFGQQPTPQFGEQRPSGGFGSEPTYKEPSSPFGNQPNFSNDPFNNQPKEWTAPPAPQGWGNQGLGQNTPFNAPPIKSQGQNQTLPLVSLITGIISVFCCWLAPILGLVALVTGFMGMSSINKNPAQFGGRGLALGGMITGGIGLAIGIIYWILVTLGTFAQNL